jgi:hypothetical protein
MCHGVTKAVFMPDSRKRASGRKSLTCQRQESVQLSRPILPVVRTVPGVSQATVPAGLAERDPVGCGRKDARYERREARDEKREARDEKREARGEKREARYEIREARGERREARSERRETRGKLRVTSCGFGTRV